MTKQNTSLQGSEEVNDPFKISLIVYQHIKEMRKEIEQEFIEVLKNNIINPYDKNTILLGNKYAFVYVGTTRYKYVIKLKFDVYRAHEVTHKHKNYRHVIGKVYVLVRITDDSE